MCNLEGAPHPGPQEALTRPQCQGGSCALGPAKPFRSLQGELCILDELRTVVVAPRWLLALHLVVAVGGGYVLLRHYRPWILALEIGLLVSGLAALLLLRELRTPREILSIGTEWLEEGDLARLEVNGVRRLIVVEDVTVGGWALQVSFSAADTVLRQPAGLTGNLQVEVPGTFIQKLHTIMFYVDDQDRLIRADRLNMDGSPDGEVVAYNLEEFDISVVFEDGDELEQPNPYDLDYTNDYDDIVAVKVRVTVRAERIDPRVNGGRLLRKTSVWYVSPRNLRYEKNRI